VTGRGRLAAALPALVSGGILFALYRTLDGGAVLAQLGRLDPRWAGAAVLVSVGQILLLAWRWRFTAARLGMELPLQTAVSEYYLGVFVNQLFPGGLVGDGARAWRHARAHGAGRAAPDADVGSDAVANVPVGPPPPGGRGAALGAVAIEKASAQVVMTGAALLSAGVLLLRAPGAWDFVGAAVIAALGVVGGAGAVLLGVRAMSVRGALAGRMWAGMRAAVLAPGPLSVHLLTGALVVASYVAVFVIGARAVGVTTPLAQLLPLVAPVLMTMLVPVTVAGWGVREGAAAALWAAVGLPAAEGMLVSLVYGVLVLVSSLPGGLVLLRWRMAPPSAEPREGRPDGGRASGPASVSGEVQIEEHV